MVSRLSKLNDEYANEISDINVTPFVDVLLVLLVIFMVTAPLFKDKSIDIQLPKENLRSAAVTDSRKLVVTINKNGTYYIRGKRYSRQALLTSLTTWKEKNNESTVYIRADRRVKYEKVTELMVLMKNNGNQSIGLLVEDKL